MTQNERIERLERLFRELADAMSSRGSVDRTPPVLCKIIAELDSPAAEQIEGGAAGKVADDGESPGDCKVAPPSPVLSDEKVAELRANRPENWLNREAIALCDTAEELRRQLAEAWQAYAEVEQTNIDLTRERDEALADATRLRQNIWTMYAASCPGWASDGRIESMVANAVRFREGIEQERDEAHADGNGVQRALSMQLSAAEAKLDGARMLLEAKSVAMEKLSARNVELVGQLHDAEVKLDEARLILLEARRRLWNDHHDKPGIGKEAICAEIDAFLVAESGAPSEADDVCYNGNHSAENGICLVDKGRKPTSPSPMCKICGGEGPLADCPECSGPATYPSPSPEVFGQWEMCEHDVYRSQHCPDCAKPKEPGPVTCLGSSCSTCPKCARPKAEPLSPAVQKAMAHFHEKLAERRANEAVAKPPPGEDVRVACQQCGGLNGQRVRYSQHGGTGSAWFCPDCEDRKAKRLATLNVLARTCREHKAAGIRLPRGVLNALAALDATEPRHE
jgi:hypothetical protein